MSRLTGRPAIGSRLVLVLAGVTLTAAGRLFVIVWGLTLVAFPWVKGVPSGIVPVALGAVAGFVALRLLERRRNTLAALDALSDARFLTIVLTLAAALRLAAVAYFPMAPMVDDAEFHKYALNILGGHGYGAPGYRAWFPPGMTLVLTAWYEITSPSPVAGKCLQILVSLLLVWQTMGLGRDVRTPRVGRVAAIIVACIPTLVFYTATLGYEILLALLLVVACRLGLALTVPSKAPGYAVALGALLGFGALVQPICLLAPLAMTVGWLLSGLSAGRIVNRLVIVGLAMAVVIGPWSWRNYEVLHAFVPISTNGGTTLYSTSNPHATGLAMNVDPVAGERDEVSRDHLRMRAALAWIWHNPADWVRLALVKITYTWGTTSSIMSVVSTDRLPPAVEAACKAVLNVCWAALWAWCAVATTRRSSWRLGFIPAAAFIFYVFGLHVFFEALSRYHVPVVPLLAVLAAAAVDSSES